jgi:hypothetical protein
VAAIAPKPAPQTVQWLRLGALGLLACAVLAAFGFWWFGVRQAATTRSTTIDSTATLTPVGGRAVAISERGLHTLALLGRVLYWAGSRPDVTYELTQHRDGRVYLRYLARGTRLGSQKAFLTIGSYPVANAYAVTRNVARRAGSVQVPVGQEAVAFYRRRLPTNIYPAFRGGDSQIEIFDPSPENAVRLVAGGVIRQVEGAAAAPPSQRARPSAVYPEPLALLAKRLGRPLYWAGRRRGARYELTRTPDGHVYVRYLPEGAKAGSSRPYLTVGTYPLANAYATTEAAAKRPGSVRIDVPGGVGFYSESRPSSVYIAFRGVSEQVEVFDPSSARAREVARHEIHAIS